MIRSALIVFLLSASLISGQGKINLDSLFSKYVEYKSDIIPSSPDGVNPGRVKCGFGLASQVRFNLNNFSHSQQAVLQKIMERPLLSNEYVSPYGHFKIHYDVSGTNKPSYDNSKSVLQNIEMIAAILDSVYTVEVGQLNYPAPPADNEGGDNLYDIYIENQSGYGYTQPEDHISGDRYTSYMSIDNDYSSYYTKGIAGAKVTIAHEMHHAIQIGNYAIRTTGNGDTQDLFFFEMTSTAMEEFVYDYVNDYYAYQKDYFNFPEKNFQGYKGYELAIWNIFLQERFGMDIIKRQWELYRNDLAFAAINNSLAEAGTSFQHELNLFGIWSYYTGYRHKMALAMSSSGESVGYFEEGNKYPMIRITPLTFSESLFPLNVSTLPMSNSFVIILNGNTSEIVDTIVSIITNGDFSALMNSPNSFFNLDYSLFDKETPGTMKMVNNYYYKIEAANRGDYTEANLLNNSVVNGGEFLLTETDFAYPNPFYEKKSRDSKLYIPVSYNRNGEARLYIYSTDMNLIYEGIRPIITPNGKFYVEWPVSDSGNNKLATGVYLYVTKSGDNIKKGKIVIFSE